jgi:hypothetical protein
MTETVEKTTKPSAIVCYVQLLVFSSVQFHCLIALLLSCVVFWSSTEFYIQKNSFSFSDCWAFCGTAQSEFPFQKYKNKRC